MTKAALADAPAINAIMEHRADQKLPLRRRRSSGSTISSSEATPPNATPTNATPSASSARSAAAARRAAVAAEHPPDACRYPNKRCYNKRAVKNNGQLHKFCEMHRDSANQYQRRLEQRLKHKRIQSRLKSLQAQREQAAALAAAVVVSGGATGAPAGLLPAAPMPRVVAPIASGTQNVLAVHYAVNHGVPLSAAPSLLRSTSVSSAVSAISTTPSSVSSPMPIVPEPIQVAPVAFVAPPTTISTTVPEFEPFRYPVPLEDEDIECLYRLFLEP